MRGAPLMEIISWKNTLMSNTIPYALQFTNLSRFDVTITRKLSATYYCRLLCTNCHAMRLRKLHYIYYHATILPTIINHLSLYFVVGFLSSQSRYSLYGAKNLHMYIV